MTTTPDRMTELLTTTDASAWAREFMDVIDGHAPDCSHQDADRSVIPCCRFEVDEGFMIGWFANAIETAKRIALEQHTRQEDTAAGQHRSPSIADGTVDTALVEQLERLGDSYGPSGVADISAEMAGREAPKRSASRGAVGTLGHSGNIRTGMSPDAPTTTNEAGGSQSALPFRFDLIDARALFAMAEVLHTGAEKYGANNWRLIPVEDHLNHMIAHAYAYLAGDRSDDHLSHALCRATFALGVLLAEDDGSS